MSKIIVTEREISSCDCCDFVRYISIEATYILIKQGKYENTLKCTRKRPHKQIPDSESIPEWCPLPDSTF